MSETVRPKIVGILNVTPDSFSDGGRWLDAGAAIARGRELLALGADIVDVGGESTRPGADRVSPDEEQRRVIPIVETLSALGIAVSVDTMRASTAVAAIEAGAQIINDVSGGLADADMLAVVADSDATFVAMHWRGHSDHMDDLARYDDVAREVRDELAARLEAITAAGIERSRVVLDPGFGFAKNAEQNWELLARLDELSALELPLLVGVSRKRFLAELLPADAAVAERDLPTSVISGLLAERGVWGVRVHDVTGTRLAIDTATRLQSVGRRPAHLKD